MKTIIARLLAAAMLLGILAGCAATGDATSAMDWLQQQEDVGGTNE